MLTINVSGWKKGYGPYSLNLPFDENRTDYEICFKDGTRYTQEGPFKTETHDWNNDGDVYSQHGAWFRSRDGRGEFFTPVDMLRLVQENQAEIPGLSDPLAAINGYLKAKEEEHEAKRLARAKAYPVTCSVGGKEIKVPFDTTKIDCRVVFASGQTFFQTGRFHEEYFLPDRTRVNPPVMATWFQDSDDNARFFTAKELIELAISGRAKVEGVDIPNETDKLQSQAKGCKRRSSDRER